MYTSAVGDPPSVLIVEDDRGVSELYDYWLDGDFTVETAADLTAAYAHLVDDFDVVVLDRNLPDGPGSELLAEIRTLGIDCQVVMVTGTEPAIDIVEMEFDDYLLKPVTREELRETVGRLVEQKQFKHSVIEYYRLKRKLSLLEDHCDPTELADNDQYATYQARLRELQNELHTTIDATPDLPFDPSSERISGD